MFVGRGSWVWAWVKVAGVGNAWWVTRIEIRVLNGFCSFEMRSHVKNRSLIESVAFVHFRV